jgi:hypothetical protein
MAHLAGLILEHCAIWALKSQDQHVQSRLLSRPQRRRAGSTCHHVDRQLRNTQWEGL